MHLRMPDLMMFKTVAMCEIYWKKRTDTMQKLH